MPRGAAMNELLERWKLDERQVRDQMYGAPTAGEREGWHAVWLVVRGWSAARAAEAVGRGGAAGGGWRGGRQPGQAKRWSGVGTRPVSGCLSSASTARPAWPLSRAAVPPRPQRGATGPGERGGPGSAPCGGDRPG